MAVLVVLFGSWVLYRVLGALGVAALQTWLSSARWAVSTMFLFTAISHFAPMKKDLIAMVPPFLPRPDVLVFVAGVAEVAGAVGLLIPHTRLLAAYGLIPLTSRFASRKHQCGASWRPASAPARDIAVVESANASAVHRVAVGGAVIEGVIRFEEATP